jgi:hypothetical protein
MRSSAAEYPTPGWVSFQSATRVSFASAATGDHDAVFRQQSAYLIDQRGARLHQLLTHSMHCLHVLLRSTFDRHETHRRSARGLADRLCIARIVLICFNVEPMSRTS